MTTGMHNSSRATITLSSDVNIKLSDSAHETLASITSPRQTMRVKDLGPSLDHTFPIHEASHHSRFKTHQQVGEGSFGVVWRAQDDVLSREVAIKHFKGNQQQAFRACQEELRFIAKLSHPYIPTIYDARVGDLEQPFIVMELLNGVSLKDIIDRLRSGDPKTHQAYPFNRRIELIIKLLEAARTAHQAGILHRDIKPENIMVGSHGEFALIDWGCAIPLDVVKERSELCGTPMFMSPEQALGLGLSKASDIFSICGVAYELLSLHHPGPACATVFETLVAIVTYQPVQLDQLYHPAQGYAPSEFMSIIMRGLERHPTQRPQSADEVICSLESTLAGEIIVVCPRTMIKSKLARLNRWLDLNPFRAVPIFYSVLTLISLSILCLGILIGSYL